MSFGFSVGDFLAVGRLAVSVYKQCRDAPAEYKALASEVRSLQNILQDVEELLEGDKLSSEKKKELLQHGKNCDVVLKELGAMMTKYHSLDSKSRRTWDRLKWDQQEGRDIRARITSNVTVLNAFYQSVTTSTVFEIQKALDQLRIDFQTGRREGSLKSVSTLQIAEDDENAWGELIRDLEDLGLTADVVNTHRSIIVDWILDAVNSGLFQEAVQSDRDTETDTEADTDDETKTKPNLGPTHITRASDQRGFILTMKPFHDNESDDSFLLDKARGLLTIDAESWALPPGHKVSDYPHGSDALIRKLEKEHSDPAQLVKLQLPLAFVFTGGDRIRLIRGSLELLESEYGLSHEKTLSALLFIQRNSIQGRETPIQTFEHYYNKALIECEIRRGLQDPVTQEYTIFMMSWWATSPRLSQSEAFYTELWARRKAESGNCSLNFLILHILGTICARRSWKPNLSKQIFRSLCCTGLQMMGWTRHRDIELWLLAAMTWLANLSIRTGDFESARCLYDWVIQVLLAKGSRMPPSEDSTQDYDLNIGWVCNESRIQQIPDDILRLAMLHRYWIERWFRNAESSTPSNKLKGKVSPFIFISWNQNRDERLRAMLFGKLKERSRFSITPISTFITGGPTEKHLAQSIHQAPKSRIKDEYDWPFPFDGHFRSDVVVDELAWFQAPARKLEIRSGSLSFLLRKLEFSTRRPLDALMGAMQKGLQRAKIDFLDEGAVLRCKLHGHVYTSFEIRFVKLSLSSLVGFYLFLKYDSPKTRTMIMKSLGPNLLQPLRAWNNDGQWSF